MFAAALALAAWALLTGLPLGDGVFGTLLSVAVDFGVGEVGALLYVGNLYVGKMDTSVCVR